jgi:hypothetical protein
MTETQLQPRDLDAGVSLGEYHGSLQALWERVREIAHDHGWCTEWIEIMHHRISADFPYERDQDDVLRDDVPVTLVGRGDSPDDRVGYAAALVRIRGRMLWYVREGTAGLGEVNEAFAAAGLPQWKSPDKRFLVDIQRLNVTAEAETETGVREKIMAALRELVIPGITISDPVVSVYRARGTRDYIPVGDVSPPEGYAT